MSPDAYLQRILDREAVDNGPLSLVRRVQARIEPTIREWAGNMLVSVEPSGSFAKGTANNSGTDIDLFISLSDQTSATLEEIYETLFNRMKSSGLNPSRQSVSINVRVSGYDVDLVPGKRQNIYNSDHSLYRRKADTWTKTNVITHINHVVTSGRIGEARVIKLWRDQKSLDFPSFYLEMTAIKALEGYIFGTLSDRVLKVLEYLRDSFSNARVVDPANTNNIISDDLTIAERGKIRSAAEQALKATNWNQIVV